MTLWQSLCTYGLALLQSVGLTSLGPLSGQSLSMQTDINHDLPSFHHANNHEASIDFDFEQAPCFIATAATPLGKTLPTNCTHGPQL